MVFVTVTDIIKTEDEEYRLGAFVSLNLEAYDGYVIKKVTLNI